MTDGDVATSFRALAAAADALAGELDVDGVLEQIVSSARAVTGAQYGALGVVGPDETLVTFIHQGIDDATVQRIGAYPRGKGLLGLLIREPEIIRLDDIAEHPASYGFPSGHPPMKTFLGAPIRSRGHIFGNLYLTEKPGGFTAQDEQLIEVLAAQAGAAVENAELSERLQDLAVQDERDRISRDLHDGVIQALFSIGMTLESARRLVTLDPDRVVERIDNAVDGIDGAIRELRNYIFRLRPGDAASMGLGRGLIELAREFEVNALTRPELEIPSDVDARVPGKIVPDVLQIAREALSNCAKHARASSVRVRVEATNAHVELEIEDDGVGFDASSFVVGRGLDNMRERASVHGGEMQIDATPGEGTRLVLTIPIEQESP